MLEGPLTDSLERWRDIKAGWGLRLPGYRWSRASFEPFQLLKASAIFCNCSTIESSTASYSTPVGSVKP